MRLWLTAAALCCTVTVARAQFVPVDLTPHANRTFATTSFPLGYDATGNQTFHGVPFTLGGVWEALAAGGDNPRTVAIPVLIPNALGASTLINSYWGAVGVPALSRIVFTFADSSTFIKDLIGDVDIRDFNQSAFTNAINGTTTRTAIDNGVGQRLDQQFYDFGTNAGKTLTEIRLEDFGADGVQRVFLAGATVRTGGAAAPEPATIALALIALPLMRRRR